jgi:hypothetical protein
MEMTISEMQDKYVKMLYALCVCDNTPMIFNQAEVSELLLSDQKVLAQMVYKLSKENGAILITISNGKQLKLSEFKQVS